MKNYLKRITEYVNNQVYACIDGLECIDNISATQLEEGKLYYTKRFVKLIIEKDRYLIQFPNLISVDENGFKQEDRIEFFIDSEMNNFEGNCTNNGSAYLTLAITTSDLEDDVEFLTLVKDEIHHFLVKKRVKKIDELIT